MLPGRWVYRGVGVRDLQIRHEPEESSSVLFSCSSTFDALPRNFSGVMFLRYPKVDDIW